MNYRNRLGWGRKGSPSRRRRLLRGLAAVGFLVVGGVTGAVWNEWRAAHRGAPAAGGPARETTATPAGVAAAPESKGDEPAEVSLTPDAVERAGIRMATVGTDRVVRSLTVPGTVTSNAYRETRVNSLVGGIVRQVFAELGTPVNRGDRLAIVFSSELADAQMKYLSMQAMLEADHQRRQRTERLAEIGAASRQELEEVTAIHIGHETEVEAARQRLVLLGLSLAQISRLTDPSHIVSEVMVPSPAGGVVIIRAVNPGQVISAGQDLFVVADLSTVWVIGDVYEKDFPLVRVGSAAQVSVPAYPGKALAGRVAYIDPRVDSQTRTAKVRVEVPNRTGELRLGMYVTVAFRTEGAGQRTVIPRSAVQTVGNRTVVYVPTAETEAQFVERPVRLGAAFGDDVEVIEGLKPGEKIVTGGSFFLRAEATRARSGS